MGHFFIVRKQTNSEFSIFYKEILNLSYLSIIKFI